MHLAVIGLSHRTAPVEIRERLSIPEQTMEDSLQQLRSDEQVLEASILSTCNRLEIYTLLRHPELGVSAVGSFLSRLSGLGLNSSPRICSPTTTKRRSTTFCGWRQVWIRSFSAKVRSCRRSRKWCGSVRSIGRWDRSSTV